MNPRLIVYAILALAALNLCRLWRHVGQGQRDLDADMVVRGLAGDGRREEGE